MLYIHVQSILADPVARKRILTSYELMLDFYGMKLKDLKTGRFTTFSYWHCNIPPVKHYISYLI